MNISIRFGLIYYPTHQVDLRSATEQDVELLKAAINTTHSVELNHDGDEKIETIQTLVMNRRTVQDSVTGIDFEKSAQDIR